MQLSFLERDAQIMGPKIKQRLDCQESSKGESEIETCIGQRKRCFNKYFCH